MADVSVRPARADEAGEIARIQRDTIAMAYGQALPPEVFAELADVRVQAEITAAIADVVRAPSGRVLAAFEGYQLVGFANVRPAVIGDDSKLEPADTDAEHTGFVEQILVEPRWGRRGHGSRLLAAAVDYFADIGCARAVIWVPEANSPTLDFLASAGWARDGYTRTFDTGRSTVRELRLHTAL